MEIPLEAVERHLSAGSRLVRELCVLPGEAGLDGCTVVVVPDVDVLRAQKVPQALKRIQDDVLVSAATSPHALRVGRVVLLDEPLERSADGAAARERIAEQVRRPREVVDAEHPTALEVLARMEQVFDVEGPLRVDQHLEADLGLDSLDLLKVRLLLEEEFGATIADDALWRVQTVGDAARCAVEAEPSPAQRAVDYSWAARLREPPAVGLDARFNMQRRGLHHLAAGLGMRLLTTVSRLAFGTELVHAERLPREGPYLLCPTHESFLDSPLVYATFPYELVHKMVFIAFGPYFRAAPGSWLVRMGRLILTGEGDSVTDSLRLAWDALQRGWIVVIFPEGSCSYTGEVMPARPGVGLLACEAQVPVVPVRYESAGTYSPQRPGFHRTKIRVHVGEPIHPPAGERFGPADYRAMADRWRDAAMELKDGPG